ncbi:DUF6005 family protein [Paenibacillus sp. 481]|uniref:DUF6005 family protein n=1 Tax=Paenibacillus sp. 481 TaxID=2835869 RepID=UPI001E58F5BD|nr:DUF6005 family protein [Paenibacillus sp. 481]UHA76182.1 Petrobactin biosynthesis protein AsbE [Paenibacillus sp. 481]
MKVHCLISCFCEIVKRYSDVDYRPFYFGVWDAPFAITEQGIIQYYTNGESYDTYLEWFERLFGPKVYKWYDPELDKESNVQTFLDLLEHRPEHRHIIVQIDMSLMPERENKFNQKPFPHYLMIYKTEREDEWFMLDPDFRWEGTVSREQVIEAIRENPLGGGFYVDADQIRTPDFEVVESYYHSSFPKQHNELTSRLKQLLIDMAAEQNGYTLSMLTAAVKNLFVLVIRKYSYEYALMYFGDTLQLSKAEHFGYWADQVEEVIQGFRKVQYTAIKMSITGDISLLPQMVSQLEKMDTIELEVKQEIERQFGLLARQYGKLESAT